MARSKKSKITNEQKQIADLQIKEVQKQIDYDTKDFTIEYLIDKYKRGDFFIPNYQRQFIWKETNKSLFIESILLGLPIPFMFFGNCENGRIEIIDGAQRIQTLEAFIAGKFKLNGLKKINEINKFCFSDLSDAQQRKFKDKTLRIITLEENTPNDVRQDLFNRINTSGVKANPSEIRRGSYPGKFTTFIEECCNNELFIELCPVPEKGENRHERFELVLRFFAYTNDYMSFIHRVNTFLDEYLISNMENFDEENFYNEFVSMLKFVKSNFPNGFAKIKNATATPRVRFEAISVGVALALREEPKLKTDSLEWLNSDEFKQYTTSDASNNQGKLRNRIEYVRNKLLERRV